MPENMEFLESVLEHIQDAVLLINRAGIVMMVGAERNQELAGRSLLDIVSKTHRKRMQKAVREAFRTRRAVTCELKARMTEPRAGWFSIRISPVLKGRKTLSAMVFASDITERRATYLAERKKLREKLRKTQERARAVENILTMCAKTKKVRFKGEWLPIEEFLWKRYGFRISHGLSPDAAEEALEIIDRSGIPSEEGDPQ